uniref:Uncharacterized protein n=1 Tax=Romanomermis culicivorax TaxID=13658 RepID=A0A915K109_ROMCU
MDRPTYDYLSFDEAAKICKLCHNADLILAQDVPELDDDALPAWIGVTAQATLMDNQLTNVTWTPHIMENLVWPTELKR